MLIMNELLLKHAFTRFAVAPHLYRLLSSPLDIRYGCPMDSLPSE